MQAEVPGAATGDLRISAEMAKRDVVVNNNHSLMEDPVGDAPAEDVPTTTPPIPAEPAPIGHAMIVPSAPTAGGQRSGRFSNVVAHLMKTPPRPMKHSRVLVEQTPPAGGIAAVAIPVHDLSPGAASGELGFPFGATSLDPLLEETLDLPLDLRASSDELIEGGLHTLGSLEVTASPTVPLLPGDTAAALAAVVDVVDSDVLADAAMTSPIPFVPPMSAAIGPPSVEATVSPTPPVSVGPADESTPMDVDSVTPVNKPEGDGSLEPPSASIAVSEGGAGDASLLGETDAPLDGAMTEHTLPSTPPPAAPTLPASLSTTSSPVRPTTEHRRHSLPLKPFILADAEAGTKVAAIADDEGCPPSRAEVHLPLPGPVHTNSTAGNAVIVGTASVGTAAQPEEAPGLMEESAPAVDHAAGEASPVVPVAEDAPHDEAVAGLNLLSSAVRFTKAVGEHRARPSRLETTAAVGDAEAMGTTYTWDRTPAAVLSDNEALLQQVELYRARMDAQEKELGVARLHFASKEAELETRLLHLTEAIQFGLYSHLRDNETASEEYREIKARLKTERKHTIQLRDTVDELRKTVRSTEADCARAAERLKAKVDAVLDELSTVKQAARLSQAKVNRLNLSLAQRAAEGGKADGEGTFGLDPAIRLEADTVKSLTIQDSRLRYGTVEYRIPAPPDAAAGKGKTVWVSHVSLLERGAVDAIKAYEVQQQASKAAADRAAAATAEARAKSAGSHWRSKAKGSLAAGARPGSRSASTSRPVSRAGSQPSQVATPSSADPSLLKKALTGALTTSAGGAVSNSWGTPSPPLGVTSTGRVHRPPPRFEAGPASGKRTDLVESPAMATARPRKPRWEYVPVDSSSESESPSSDGALPPRRRRGRGNASKSPTPNSSEDESADPPRLTSRAARESAQSTGKVGVKRPLLHAANSPDGRSTPRVDSDSDSEGDTVTISPARPARDKKRRQPAHESRGSERKPLESNAQPRGVKRPHPSRGHTERPAKKAGPPVRRQGSADADLTPTIVDDAIQPNAPEKSASIPRKPTRHAPTHPPPKAGEKIGNADSGEKKGGKVELGPRVTSTGRTHRPPPRFEAGPASGKREGPPPPVVKPRWEWVDEDGNRVDAVDAEPPSRTTTKPPSSKAAKAAAGPTGSAPAKKARGKESKKAHTSDGVTPSASGATSQRSPSGTTAAAADSPPEEAPPKVKAAGLMRLGSRISSILKGGAAAGGSKAAAGTAEASVTRPPPTTTIPAKLPPRSVRSVRASADGARPTDASTESPATATASVAGDLDSPGARLGGPPTVGEVAAGTPVQRSRARAVDVTRPLAAPTALTIAQTNGWTPAAPSVPPTRVTNASVDAGVESTVASTNAAAGNGRKPPPLRKVPPAAPPALRKVPLPAGAPLRKVATSASTAATGPPPLRKASTQPPPLRKVAPSSEDADKTPLLAPSKLAATHADDVALATLPLTSTTSIPATSAVDSSTMNVDGEAEHVDGKPSDSQAKSERGTDADPAPVIAPRSKRQHKAPARFKAGPASAKLKGDETFEDVVSQWGTTKRMGGELEASRLTKRPRQKTR